MRKTAKGDQGMLRSVKELRGYAIQAADSQIGTVDGFLFDDLTCNRRVLLSAVSLGQPEWEEHIFPVGLTKEQVENSPPVAVDRPVSRQMEEKLVAHYSWPAYWKGAMATVPQRPSKTALSSTLPPPSTAGEMGIEGVFDIWADILWR
jgi:hypothetical protein